MPTKKDIRAFEAAVQSMLAPLAGLAESRGISRRRFASIVADAARGRLASVEPDLPYDAAVRLVSRWSTDPAYASRGRPRLLALEGPRSFRGLVRAARAGSPAVALAALEGSGVARRDRQGRVHLLQQAYVPATGDDVRLDIAGRAAGEFLRVLAHNLSAPPEERFLQRTASYDNIGASSLMTLRKALRREGLQALDRANDLLASRDRDRRVRAPGGRRTRVSFGVYLLAEPIGPMRRRKR